MLNITEYQDKHQTTYEYYVFIEKIKLHLRENKSLKQTKIRATFPETNTITMKL